MVAGSALIVAGTIGAVASGPSNPRALALPPALTLTLTLILTLTLTPTLTRWPPDPSRSSRSRPSSCATSGLNNSPPYISPPYISAPQLPYNLPTCASALISALYLSYIPPHLPYVSPTQVRLLALAHMARLRRRRVGALDRDAGTYKDTTTDLIARLVLWYRYTDTTRKIQIQRTDR